MLRPAPAAGQFHKLESSRRTLAIRLVTTLSGTGLLLVVAAWVVSR